MNDTKSKLLDAAAPLVQTRGYNGFSFHDLSEAVGIRTASIHYHFPTKGDLCKALVIRYERDFLTALGDPADGTPDERLTHYVGTFRAALANGRMCLCGMIGVEVGSVPADVSQSVRAFFVSNENWLAKVYARRGFSTPKSRLRAKLLLSALEGALLIARSLDDTATFDDVAALVLSLDGPK